MHCTTKNFHELLLGSNPKQLTHFDTTTNLDASYYSTFWVKWVGFLLLPVVKNSRLATVEGRERGVRACKIENQRTPIWHTSNAQIKYPLESSPSIQTGGALESAEEDLSNGCVRSLRKGSKCHKKELSNTTNCRTFATTKTSTFFRQKFSSRDSSRFYPWKARIVSAFTGHSTKILKIFREENFLHLFLCDWGEQDDRIWFFSCFNDF